MAFRKTLFVALLLMTGAVFALASAKADDEVVDIELVMAVDVSLSMQQNELEIQRRGYAAAIVDPRVLQAIADGIHGKIAVTYVEWAGNTSQRTIIPWRRIASGADAQAVADALISTRASGMRRTSISAAIDHSVQLFENNGFRGLKRVIDVSGDGPNNQGRAVTEARDAAVAKGIVINGLPLITHDISPFGSFDIPDLDQFYANCVIGGPGAFMVPVNEWRHFPAAIRRKLVLEIAGHGPVKERLPIVPVAVKGLPYDCLVGERIWRERFQQGP